MIVSKRGLFRRVLSGTYPPGPYEYKTILASYALACGHVVARTVHTMGAWAAPAPSRRLLCDVCRRERKAVQP